MGRSRRSTTPLHTRWFPKRCRASPRYEAAARRFLKKGEGRPRVPGIFHCCRIALNNRLGLARWVVPDHPAQRARRCQSLPQLFGRHRQTIGDFCTQGEYPSHPELLDSLAVDFASNWDEGNPQKDHASIPTSNLDRGRSCEQNRSHNRLVCASRFRLSAEETATAPSPFRDC